MTPKDRETLAQMLNEHRKRIAIASFFVCGACGLTKHTHDYAGCFPFFPKRRHKTSEFATYVICKPCTNKTPDDVYDGVSTYLAKQGFFVKA